MIRTFDLEEFKHLTHHVEDVRAGRYVIMVLTKRREQRIVAARHPAPVRRRVRRLLRPMGVGGSSRRAHHMTPADVPALFVQAWNARDPDALASLFDDDAEFVNGDRSRSGTTGRRSERGTRTRLARAPPTIDAGGRRNEGQAAVTGSRGGSRADDAVRRDDRTRTIVSFVVHRAGERWLCASAHNTDVVPEAGAVRQAAAG